jgi:hypothetical protein
MSLRSIDISKVNRLSIKGATLPTTEVRPLPILEIVKKDPAPNYEEAIFSKLLDLNPLLSVLVETFDLVSERTGERIKTLKQEEPLLPHPEPKIIPIKTESLSKVEDLAYKILKGENSYSKEAIINLIQEEAKVNIETAEGGFNLMTERKVIRIAKVTGLYYLQGSTPF